MSEFISKLVNVIASDASIHAAYYIGFLAGGFVFGWISRWFRSDRKRRRIFRVSGSVKFTLVFADREIPGSGSNTVPRTFVASEDMAALHLMQDALIRAGVQPDRITWREASQFDKPPHLDDHKTNVILVCKTNAVTLTFLDLLRDIRTIDWRFERVDDSRWSIATGGAPWLSPSYEQEATLQALGKTTAEGPLDDYAICGRVPNPFNPDTKVFIVAGIRGIGTRGVGEFFNKHTDLIWSKTKGKDFLSVLKVSYKDRQVDGIKVVQWGPDRH